MKIETLLKNLDFEILKHPYAEESIKELKTIFENAHSPNTSVDIAVEIIKNEGVLCLNNTNINYKSCFNSYDIIKYQKNINELYYHYNKAKLIQDNYDLLYLNDEDIEIFDKYVKQLSKTYISALVDMESIYVPQLIHKINNLNDNINLELIHNAKLLIECYKLTNDDLSNRITELHQAISIYCKKHNITQEQLDNFNNEKVVKDTKSKSTVWNKDATKNF